MTFFKILDRLKPANGGSVLAETALWVSLLGVPMVAGVDLGVYAVQKLRVNDAVSQASMSAFQSRDAVNAQTIRNIANTISPMTVTVTCNGNTSCVNTNRSCGCITGFTNGVPTFTAAANCNATCANGTSAGYYMTIRGQKTYQPVLNTGILALPTSIDQTVTIALQ